MPRVRESEEDKENFKVPGDLHSGKSRRSLKAADATLVEDNSDVLQITNTSFETLEEMCEKTASDPDSTLFWYLNNNAGGSSASQVQATRAAQPAVSYDEEADALQRLLDELNVEETEKRLRAQEALANETQLDDIEEPSKFWENTLTAETLQSISPVKMVGLMRQSTIMECSEASESEVSTTSYQSAMKTGFSSETTGCYETANDTVTGSESGAVKKVSINSSGASSSSELFQQRHSRQKFFEERPAEKSVHLIDLETTVMDQKSDILDYQDSLEPVESSKDSLDEPEDSLEPLKSSPESTQLTESEGSRSIIELSDEESLGCSKILEKIAQLEAESVLNRSFSVEREDAAGEEKESLHFNDTMEEVEYMMKKGMQYMQAAKAPSPLKDFLSPVKKTERYRSPSPMLSSPMTPKTVIAKPKPVNKHTMDIKPFPKLDLFKKPQASSRLRPPAVENKFTSSLKKPQYSHIYSPIRAYINKTPTTPLLTTIKPSSTNSNVTSKAFQQVEMDSRVTPQNLQTPSSSSTNSPSKAYVCSLPKKAYISSEFKHIVDERTQITIPGGPKIQRYLHSSLVPAVVRHEGKVKIPVNLRTSEMGPPPPSAPRSTNDSLANLSLASGDVSVYTIKDAQKF